MKEEVLRQILAMAPFGYAYHRLVLDPEGNPQDHIFLEVNKAFEELTGLKAEDIIGKPMTEAVPDTKEDALDWKGFYRSLNPIGGARETVRYSKALDRWYRVNAFSPEPHHFVTILEDVTAEIKRIRLLEEQKEQIKRLLRDYQLMFNQAHEPIFLVGVEEAGFRYISINPAFKKLTGFEESDILGKSPTEVMGWEGLGERLEMNYFHCWHSGIPISYEEQVSVPLGNKMWHTVLSPVYEKGKIKYLLGMMRDITWEKLAQKELEKKARYEKTVSTIARLGLKERDLDVFLPRALALLGECLEASRVYIFERDEENRTLSNIYEWVAEGIAAQKENLQNLPEEIFAWWTETLAAGAVINYRDIEEIPEESSRETLKAQDIKSILVMPLFVENRYWGFLGFDECINHRDWTEEDLLILNLSADIISTYLERHVQEQKIKKENRRFKALMESTEDVIFELDTELRFRGIYGKGLYRYGVKPEQFLGKTAREFYGEDEAEVHEAANLKALRGELAVYEWKREGKEGTKYCQTSLSPIVSERGSVTGIVGIVRDITALVELQQALQAEKELLRVTLESIKDAVVTTDAKGVVTSANRVAIKMSKLEGKDCLGKSFKEAFELINEYTGQAIEDPVKQLLPKVKASDLTNNISLGTRRNGRISIAYSLAPIKNEEGRILGTVMVFRDVTRERKRQERIRYLSIMDPLTGLFNRRYMEEKIKEFEGSQTLPCTVIMADVNGLKFVNDVFGHQEGDRLLKAAARVIKKSCSDDCVVARWGGDEFLVLLSGSSDRAEEIAKKIKARAAAAKSKSLPLSLALGWAEKTVFGPSLERVLKEAEENMYRNKLVEGRSYRRAIVDSLVITLNERSIETIEHCERIKYLCLNLAERIGLSGRDLDELMLLALLHDIGKIGINENILNKPGPLDIQEWAEIKRHPEIGYRIASGTPELAKIAELILYHHERWDGRGYPHGLRGEEIPYLCRLMGVADAFDAMTGPRPYRKTVKVKEALSEIERNAGTQFDPEIARIFVEMMKS